jgi:glycosyltransferase involved in cell wall biosynthesis
MGEGYPEIEGKRVCLITSGPIGSDPRLVKEARALHLHGAKVQVISIITSLLPHLLRRNESVLAGVDWPCVQIQSGSRAKRILPAMAQKLARLLLRAGCHSTGLAVRAFNRTTQALRREALRHPADLYIAHNLAALPAAAAAAQRHGARLGFDAEDFHSGELPEELAWNFDRGLARTLEAHYMPRCDVVTAASPGIARAYAASCGIPEPHTVLNVFPRTEAAEGPVREGPRPPGPSLYWFSQTTGPGRGLEEVIRAMGSTRTRPHLHLRGTVAAAYRQELESLAHAHGLEGRLHFLDPEAPAEMARLAAQYDLGLAMEPGGTPNSRLALSNKIFTYLLAGVPSIASATTAQAELALEAPGAVFLYPPGDAEALAALLDGILESPARLAESRTRAWDLGQNRFNWDQEQHAFLEIVNQALSKPRLRPAAETGP